MMYLPISRARIRIRAGDITNQILQIAIRARSRVLGPFSPSFNIDTMIREGLQKVINNASS